MDSLVHISPRLAKFTMPSAVGAIIRDRLFMRLDASRSAIWVGAPAGAGKTTLLASYIETRLCPVLWYQVDSGDADPASFFYFIGLAARRIAPGASHLPLLTPEYLPDLAGFARRFFRLLFSLLPDRSMVVFDNYQEVADLVVFHTIARSMLEDLPPGIRVALLGRNALPASLTRFHANRTMDIVAWEDLRLSAEESRSLLGVSVEGAAAEHLHRISQGWAAGLLLLRDHCGITTPLQAAGLEQSPEILFNYFASEIFESVAPPVRRLLARTAFFSSFTAEMAQVASGVADAGEVLDELTRNHFFVGRRSVPEITYEYHALFQSFLRQLSHDPAECAELKREAAHILAAHGRPEHAVDLYLDVGDAQAATIMILSLAPRVIAQGRWQTLRQWIDSLSPGQVNETPWLMFWRGMSDLASAPSAARAWLERAHERFERDRDFVGQLFSASGAMDARFLEWSEFQPLDKWIVIAQNLWGRLSQLPSPAHELRVVTSMLAAMTYRQPEHPMLPRAARRIMALINEDMDPNQKAFSLTQLLQYFDWMADFENARQVNAAIQQLLDSGKLTPLSEVWTRIMRAHGHCIQGAHAEGIRELADAFAIANADGQGLLIGVTCLARAFTELSTGNLAEARRQIQNAGARIHPGRLMDVALFHALKSWLALLEGNAELAIEQAMISVDTADATGSSVSQVWSRTTLALALGESGDVAGAGRAVETAHVLVAGLEKGLFCFHITLIRADLMLRSGDSASGRELLRQALSLGARNRYADNLEWLPAMMSRLCAEALRAGIEEDYVRGLIRQRGLMAPTSFVAGWPWPLEIRVLGPFAVRRDGQRLEFSRKTPKKPIALLKGLIALGGRDVAEARLADQLWPGSEADAAHESLAVNLHRLRKILGNQDAIVLKEGRISLNAELCWVDVWTFDNLIERARGRRELNGDGVAEHEAQAAIALYRGDFLAAEQEESWMIPMRERLRGRFVQHIATLAQECCASGRHEQEVGYYLRGIEIDELVEVFYQNLMRCYLERGRRAEGLAIYHRLHKVLVLGHGITLAPESTALGTALQNI